MKSNKKSLICRKSRFVNSLGLLSILKFAAHSRICNTCLCDSSFSSWKWGEASTKTLPYEDIYAHLWDPFSSHTVTCFSLLVYRDHAIYMYIQMHKWSWSLGTVQNIALKLTLTLWLLSARSSLLRYVILQNALYLFLWSTQLCAVFKISLLQTGMQVRSKWWEYAISWK